MNTPAVTILTVPHAQLTSAQMGQLRDLFDSEYRADYGNWDPTLPYGYAPHDIHVIAQENDTIVGHVGWGQRNITVGAQQVTIAGVGGVLVAPPWRGKNLGQQLMTAAHQAMLTDPCIDYGYLGCAETVVDFYLSCGWQRISQPERFISRNGTPVAAPAGPPILILPVGRPLTDWPDGEIDLNGKPW